MTRQRNPASSLRILSFESSAGMLQVVVADEIHKIEILLLSQEFNNKLFKYIFVLHD